MAWRENKMSRWALVAGAWLALVTDLAPAQGISPVSLPVQTLQPQVDTTLDVMTAVGFIDSALPRNQARIRYSAMYRDTQPSRAEYLFPKSAVAPAPGWPLPETRVDWQESSVFLELAPASRLSIFLESPMRWLNPAVNANQYGGGDLSGGFKFALIANPTLLTTFQLRLEVPTGHGPLGTEHVSIEPGLLLNMRLAQSLTLEGEARFWAPLGGTDFAGDVVRYGLGLAYGQRSAREIWLTPVVEFVGWTVLNGKTLVVHAPDNFVAVNAGGETIVNANIGLRLGLGYQAELFTGYGHALTGPTWYKDIVRVEFRILF